MKIFITQISRTDKRTLAVHVMLEDDLLEIGTIADVTVMLDYEPNLTLYEIEGLARLKTRAFLGLCMSALHGPDRGR